MKDNNRPWSFKHKEFKAYMKEVWKENPHLTSRTQVALKICREHQTIPKLNQKIKELIDANELLRQSGISHETPECLSRFQHEGDYFCVTKKGTAKKLLTLKICTKCQWRLTEERAKHEGLLLKTKSYVTCEAKEYYDKKKGLMLYCPKHFQGRWITMKECETAKCNYFKQVQTTDFPRISKR